VLYHTARPPSQCHNKHHIFRYVTPNKDEYHWHRNARLALVRLAQVVQYKSHIPGYDLNHAADMHWGQHPNMRM
jgi:hypothetical protein